MHYLVMLAGAAVAFFAFGMPKQTASHSDRMPALAAKHGFNAFEQDLVRLCMASMARDGIMKPRAYVRVRGRSTRIPVSIPDKCGCVVSEVRGYVAYTDPKFVRAAVDLASVYSDSERAIRNVAERNDVSWVRLFAKLQMKQSIRKSCRDGHRYLTADERSAFRS
ncbi:MAG: hypothetical protein AAFR23_08600 [Pseudomonadota bacterium]